MTKQEETLFQQLEKIVLKVAEILEAHENRITKLESKINGLPRTEA